MSYVTKMVPEENFGIPPRKISIQNWTCGFLKTRRAFAWMRIPDFKDMTDFPISAPSSAQRPERKPATFPTKPYLDVHDGTIFKVSCIDDLKDEKSCTVWARIINIGHTKKDEVACKNDCELFTSFTKLLFEHFETVDNFRLARHCAALDVSLWCLALMLDLELDDSSLLSVADITRSFLLTAKGFETQDGHNVSRKGKRVALATF